MAKASKPKRSQKLLTLFGLGILIVAIALPLVGLLSGHQTSSPEAFEEHQELVADVVLSADRADLMGQSPTRGNPNAQVILFKFSDFQCPFCGEASGQMKAFMDDNEADVLYVYKHFPLSQIHPEAVPAARAAWAAQQQGQFWAYHDALFAEQSRLGEELYEETAAALNLDVEQFNRDRNSSASKAAVDQDLELAQQLRLTTTPTFILNDLLIAGGPPIEFLNRLIADLHQQQQ